MAESTLDERLSLATVTPDGTVHSSTAAWRESSGGSERLAEVFDDAERVLQNLATDDYCVAKRLAQRKWMALSVVKKEGDSLVIEITCGDVKALARERDGLRDELEFMSFQTELLSTFTKVMQTAPVVLWSADTAGGITMHEGAGLERIGMKSQLGTNLLARATAEQKKAFERAIANESSVITEEPVAGAFFETWYMPLHDEANRITGALGLSIDVTQRVQRERENARQVALIASQSDTIRTLACPTLYVGDEILCVPIIGSITKARAADIADRLLAEIVRVSARYAILDLTGVDVVDTSTVASLLRVVNAARIVGVETLVSGLSPAIAETLVSLQVDLAGLRTMRTLRDAVAYCVTNRDRQRRAT